LGKGKEIERRRACIRVIAGSRKNFIHTPPSFANGFRYGNYVLCL